MTVRVLRSKLKQLSVGAIRRRKTSLCSKCRRPRTSDTGHQWYQSAAYQGRRGGSHVYCPLHDGDFKEWKLKWDQNDWDKIDDHKDIVDEDDGRPTMVNISSVTSSVPPPPPSSSPSTGSLHDIM